MSTLKFMKEVIRANKTTGALAPSSDLLADLVTSMARVPKAKVIVEYGPGTGVFTEAILRKKTPEAFFIALEVNEEFVKATQARCPGATVLHDSAQNAIRYLRAAGHEGCDCIVSGLPWTRFDEPLQDDILNATYDVLVPGGIFVTFGYTFSTMFAPGRRFFRGKFPAKFPKCSRSEPVWKNFPPCYVYIAEKE